jgi:hypothetical protein
MKLSVDRLMIWLIISLQINCKYYIDSNDRRIYTTYSTEPIFIENNGVTLNQFLLMRIKNLKSCNDIHSIGFKFVILQSGKVDSIDIIKPKHSSISDAEIFYLKKDIRDNSTWIPGTCGSDNIDCLTSFKVYINHR